MKKKTVLNRKAKAGIIVLIVFSYIIIAAFLGIYELGPSDFRGGWVEGRSKHGEAGESLFYNFTFEARGGRMIYHFEILDVRSDWNVHVTPRKIDVAPGEMRTISIRVDIPEEAEVGDYHATDFTLLSGTNTHGFIRDPHEVPLTLDTNVVEESPTSEIDNTDPLNGWRWAEGVVGIDWIGAIAHLFFITFISTVILYLLPEVKKKLQSK
jgi:hypothetical protein